MTARVTQAEELRFSGSTIWLILTVSGTLLLFAVSATWYVSETLHRIETGVNSIRRNAWTVKDAKRYHNELQAALKTTKVVDGRLMVDFPPPYPPNDDNE